MADGQNYDNNSMRLTTRAKIGSNGNTTYKVQVSQVINQKLERQCMVAARVYMVPKRQLVS